MDLLFFKIALFAYFLSTAGYTISLLAKRVLPARLSAWIFLSAFLLHTVSLLFRGVDAGLNPAANLHEALSFFAWAVSGIYLFIQSKTKTKVLGAFVAPVSFLLMLAAAGGLGASLAVPSVLKGSLVTLHIVLSIIGEALFALAGCAGVVYLIQDTFIKHRKMTGFSRILPSLGDLDRINHLCLLLGFPLLTLGVIAGSIWAGTVWGSHWNWDPKQVFTLIAWLSYAVLLHQRLAIGWSGRKAALLSIAAFLVILFTLIGVNVMFTTSHSFV
ncbi:MAG: c-type cytochrome biogenesis protein CcsB [Syntrophales bacterium]